MCINFAWRNITLSSIKAPEQDHDFKPRLLNYLILFLIAAVQFSSPYRQRAPAPLDPELTLLCLAQLGQMGIQENPKQGWEPRLRSRLTQACIPALILPGLPRPLTAVNLIFPIWKGYLSALFFSICKS